MKHVTIRSYRNASELLAFEWPDRAPNTAGEFVGKVVCNVINPAWPMILSYRAKWAVDTALNYSRDDSFGEVFNDLAKLKTWLRYAPLQITELTSNKLGVCKTDQVETLMYINENRIGIHKDEDIPAAIINEDRPASSREKLQELDDISEGLSRPVPSKVCAIL